MQLANEYVPTVENVVQHQMIVVQTVVGVVELGFAWQKKDLEYVKMSTMTFYLKLRKFNLLNYVEMF